jgi:hypothetical protein
LGAACQEPIQEVLIRQVPLATIQNHPYQEFQVAIQVGFKQVALK